MTRCGGACPINFTTRWQVRRDACEPGMHSILFDSIAADNPPTHCSFVTLLMSVNVKAEWSTVNHVA